MKAPAKPALESSISDRYKNQNNVGLQDFLGLGMAVRVTVCSDVILIGFGSLNKTQRYANDR